MAVAGMRSAKAELVWSDPVQQVRVAPGTKEMVIRFAYHNAGEAPVTIVEIDASCGRCTKVEALDTVIQPNQKGDLPVRFEVSGRRGVQGRSLYVTTDDQKTMHLQAQFMVGMDAVALKPDRLVWQVGQKAEAKQVSLTIAPNSQAKVTSVTSTNPRIKTALTAGSESGKYTLSVQPLATDRAETAQVIVHTHSPPEKPKAYTINVEIRPGRR